MTDKTKRIKIITKNTKKIIKMYWQFEIRWYNENINKKETKNRGKDATDHQKHKLNSNF